MLKDVATSSASTTQPRFVKSQWWFLTGPAQAKAAAIGWMFLQESEWRKACKAWWKWG